MPIYFQDGLPLAWEESGQGTPFVLLHPFPLNSSFWSFQRDAFAGVARVISPDFRGFGRSGQDGRISSMELLADDLAALLEHVGLERIVLGGLSMGGYVALAFIRKYPRQVQALLLADTRPQADTLEGRQAREELALLATGKGSSAVAESMLPRLLGRTTLENRPNLVTHVRQLIEHTTPAAIAAASRGMACRSDSTGMLGAIHCPVLVISGEEDVLTTPQAAAAWAKEIPGAQLVTLKSAGHLSALEQPEAFNQAALAFLSQKK
jgi:3-oxoadipate enol-lactonase